MSIPKQLKNLLEEGDPSIIKAMYDERHTMGKDADHKTVTVQYVRMVLSGERTTKRENTVADEVIRIAVKYLEHKRQTRDSILAL